MKKGGEKGGKIMDNCGLYNWVDDGSLYHNEEDSGSKWMGVGRQVLGKVWAKD